MDAITPPLNPTSHSPSSMLRYLVVFALLVVIFGATFWYVNKRGSKQVERAGPVFDPAGQFVPKGNASLDVDQALARFGFVKPLPFFDKNNVVQSLDVKKPDLTGTSTSRQSATSAALSPSTYLSYYIEEQSATTVHDALVDYFRSIGWKQAGGGQDASFFSFFSPGDHELVHISLLEKVSSGTKDQEVITAVLTLRPIIVNRTNRK